MPPHGVFIGIVKNQPEMIKADNPAKRFGYAREQGVEIGPPCDRSGERQNSFINVDGGCSHGLDHNGFRHLSSACAMTPVISRCCVCADVRHAHGAGSGDGRATSAAGCASARARFISKCHFQIS